MFGFGRKDRVGVGVRVRVGAEVVQPPSPSLPPAASSCRAGWQSRWSRRPGCRSSAPSRRPPAWRRACTTRRSSGARPCERCRSECSSSHHPPERGGREGGAGRRYETVANLPALHTLPFLLPSSTPSDFLPAMPTFIRLRRLSTPHLSLEYPLPLTKPPAYPPNLPTSPHPSPLSLPHLSLPAFMPPSVPSSLPPTLPPTHPLFLHPPLPPSLLPQPFLAHRCGSRLAVRVDVCVLVLLLLPQLHRLRRHIQ